MVKNLTPTASEEKLEEASSQLLDRQFLFEKDNKVLYIKINGELIPIGGACKQDLFEAGDNIEIKNVEERGTITDPLQIVRLKDDIDINSMKLTPEGEEVNWLGTYRLGSLYNGNLIFLLTEETALDDTKGFIGGEVFIEMFRADGLTSYAHYEVTSTSTGSWSLSGACEDTAEVRMIRAKWNNKYYYGLKLPKSALVYTRTETKTRMVTKVRQEEVLKTDENQTDTLYLQVGRPQRTDGTLTTYDSEDIAEYGTTRFILNGSNRNSTLLERYTLRNADGITWYKVSAKNLLTSMPESYEHNTNWTTWAENDYWFLFKMYTLQVDKGTSDIDYSGSDGSLDQHQENIIRLRVDNVPWNNNFINFDTSIYDWSTKSFVSLEGYFNSLYGPSGYGGFYDIPLTTWEKFMNFEFLGELAKYRDLGYFLRLRLYYRYVNKSFGITFYNIVKTHSTEEDVGNEVELEDPNFFSFAVGTGNYFDPVYPGDVRDFGTCQNFVIKAQVVDTLDNRLKIQIPEVRVYKGTLPNSVPSRSKCEFYYKDDGTGTLVCSEEGISELKFFDSSYPIDSDSSNTDPLFGENNYAYLKYGVESETGDEQVGSWSVLATTKDDYTYPVLVDVEYEEEEEYEEEIEEVYASAIQGARFWFNGWQTCNLPTGYTDSNLSYQVLSDKSNDNDSYAGTYYYPDVASYLDPNEGITSLPDTGEDNAPYKIIINQEYLSMQDLKDIASYVQHLERQVYLDLSKCKVKDDAKAWTTAIFEGCASLREISIPQGVEDFGQGIFKWCTYLRKVDLTPSEGTLNVIGGTTWEQNAGFLVSTRVTTLLIPKTVSLLRNYLVYASNLKTLIFLHDSGIAFKEDQSNSSAANRQNTLSTSNWAWVGQTSSGGLVYELPEGFHIFFSKSFWEDGKSKGNNNGQPNKNGSGWDWYPTMQNTSRWNGKVISSIGIYPQDGTQAEWQEFNDKYHWGEKLVNEVRSKFGHTDLITIID